VGAKEGAREEERMFATSRGWEKRLDLLNFGRGEKRAEERSSREGRFFAERGGKKNKKRGDLATARRER